ncbi:MAG: rRNA pseudouridine synthase [Epulopiscium sp.]|nr:rRNA pseudouridine synthase [Candidatus Epulonipiscium sp.]
MRLQKYIADCGIASRRKAEELILDGKIKVNENTILTLGTKIDPSYDKVYYEGNLITPQERKVYVMLHKPEQYVTTVKDQFNRPTVMKLLTDITERIFPIGRLDYHTTGLLLLTNDGDLAHKLTHPRYEVPKKYLATVEGIPEESQLVQLRRGIRIEDYITAPASVTFIRKYHHHSVLEIEIKEGRNRQVRKMCEAIGHPVQELERVSVGFLTLGNLKKGEYRHLTPKEIKYLKSL